MGGMRGRWPFFRKRRISRPMSKRDYDFRITLILALGCFVIGVLGWTLVALIVYTLLTL